MHIKTKLQLGLGFIFLLITLICGICIYYVNTLAGVSKLIIKDNYETIAYSRNMLVDLNTLDSMTQTHRKSDFMKNLKAQENNITEPGEAEKTAHLRLLAERYFSITDSTITSVALNAADSHKITIYLMQKDLYGLMELNMKAIVLKNQHAERTAGNAIIFVSVTCTICFLLAFTFIVNFPGYIANPVKELTMGIQEIARKNYSLRLHYQENDEFGQLAESFNEMAYKLDEFEHSNLAKIVFEKKRVETIIRNMSDMIIGLDENDRILFANPVACNLLGVKEIDMITVYAPDFALKNDLFRTLIRDQADKVIKIFADNKESYFSKETLEIKNADTVLGKVILLKNITKFQELDKAKTNFIATISHELKTPISSIKLSLKLLSDERIGHLNQEQQQLIGNIMEDSHRLLTITGELLDLAQVETGHIQLNIQSTDPQAILDYSLEAVKIPARQKQVNIQIDLVQNMPLILADQEKTAWVLINLLSNALRYSPEKGNIMLTIKETENQVEFSVLDFGKGIEEQYRKLIFDRFFRVPSEINFEKNGSGLGLSISKDFIESQGGSIGVESTVDQGSRFWFALNKA